MPRRPTDSAHRKWQFAKGPWTLRARAMMLKRMYGDELPWIAAEMERELINHAIVEYAVEECVDGE